MSKVTKSWQVCNLDTAPLYKEGIEAQEGCQDQSQPAWPSSALLQPLWVSSANQRAGWVPKPHPWAACGNSGDSAALLSCLGLLPKPQHSSLAVWTLLLNSLGTPSESQQPSWALAVVPPCWVVSVAHLGLATTLEQCQPPSWSTASLPNLVIPLRWSCPPPHPWSCRSGAETKEGCRGPLAHLRE